MKWPLVSRRAYEDMCEARDGCRLELLAQREMYQEALREAAKEREALTDRLVTLQRAGFQAPLPAPVGHPQPTRLPPKVLAAIAERMDPKGQAAQQTAQLAGLWLEADIPEREVVSRILQGAA